MDGKPERAAWAKMGILVNEKPERAVQEKVRDIYKRLYTQQVENLKGRLGQKWVSWWTENLKGRSKKKLRIKAYDYVPLDHLQGPLLQTSSSNGTNQFNHFLLTTRDEMFEDMGAISELEPNEIIST